jgi:hypothetical protein
MQFTTKAIRVADFFNNPRAMVLLGEYAEECAHAVLPPPAPQPETYAQLEQTGWMSLLGLFGDDRLEGFATILTGPNAHYGGLRLATTESLFVGREAREAGGGAVLMRSVMTIAKLEGAAALMVSAPMGGSLQAALRGAKKFREMSRVYVRALC